MLRHLGEKAAAGRLEKAVAQVIREGKQVTYDLKDDRNDPTAVGTREMTDAIISKIKPIKPRGKKREPVHEAAASTAATGEME
jgi:isocitrate dehydrogenase (NAD+)